MNWKNGHRIWGIYGLEEIEYWKAMVGKLNLKLCRLLLVLKCSVNLAGKA
jgi:hypothetical protein